MYKSKLQELCHQHSWTLPTYVAVKEGSDHNPKFRATVTVNGVEFSTPSEQCRSSKEAQNQAAKLAFDHFSLPPAPNGSSVSKSSIQPAKTGIVQTSVHSSLQTINNMMAASLTFKGSPVSKSSIQPAKTDIMQTSVQSSLQTINNMMATSLTIKEVPSNIYKNQLQMYAQKKNLELPSYSSETEGPPHSRRFKSTVTIDGKSYSSPDFYPTLKVAEQAAAKVALESLPCSEIAEDDSLYKGLLQDLTIVEGLGAPIYETTKSGPPHLPTFVSIVGIKSENFQGQECKLKKQAEISAAKVAYKCLMDRRANRNSEQKSETTNELQVNVKREHQENEAKTNIIIQNRVCEEDKDRSMQSPGIVFPRMADYESESTKVNSFSLEKHANEDTKRKSKTIVENKLDSETKKVIVCPRNQNETYPTGSTILPFSDGKWIAMAMYTEINPNA